MEPPLRILALAFTALVMAQPVHAADTDKVTITLVLKDHRFTPATITAPAGRKIEIVLVNKDAAYEEFDSEDLATEEDVTPNGQSRFQVGPLKPGTYHFMGEKHAKTAQGVLIVK